MDISHYEPQSDVLKQFIQFYYFLETEYAEPVQFYAFPHFDKPLNIHRGIEYSISEHETAVHGVDNYSPQILLQGVYQEPILVRFSGGIQKVTIIFRDGGLCNFMDEPYTDVAAAHTQLFTCWEKLPQYSSFIKEFFESKDHDNRIKLLESFLLSALKEKKDWGTYWHISKLLKDVDHNYKISEIAKEAFISEKTLHRLVVKYTGMSPLSFKKIVQFRHSLETKVLAEKFQSLTDIAYKSNYYDASYFNKIYKSLTLKSPKEFFKNVDLYCNKKVVFEWQKNV